MSVRRSALDVSVRGAARITCWDGELEGGVGPAARRLCGGKHLGISRSGPLSGIQSFLWFPAFAGTSVMGIIKKTRIMLRTICFRWRAACRRARLAQFPRPSNAVRAIRRGRITILALPAGARVLIGSARTISEGLKPPGGQPVIGSTTAPGSGSNSRA